MATKINTSVDGMFRAGQISSKEWARLSMNANGKGGKTKGRMAEMMPKKKDEAGAHENRSVPGTKVGHIDGGKQGMGTAAHGAGPPSRGGGVHGNAGRTTSRAIDEKQKPNFPRQGAGKVARKTLSAQQPATTNSSHTGRDSYYGGPNRRAEAPMRVGKVMTGGSKF